VIASPWFAIGIPLEPTRFHRPVIVLNFVTEKSILLVQMHPGVEKVPTKSLVSNSDWCLLTLFVFFGSLRLSFRHFSMPLLGCLSGFPTLGDIADGNYARVNSLNNLPLMVNVGERNSSSWGNRTGNTSPYDLSAYSYTKSSLESFRTIVKFRSYHRLLIWLKKLAFGTKIGYGTSRYGFLDTRPLKGTLGFCDASIG
jgi:hypothetical protein